MISTNPSRTSSKNESSLRDRQALQNLLGRIDYDPLFHEMGPTVQMHLFASLVVEDVESNIQGTGQINLECILFYPDKTRKAL